MFSAHGSIYAIDDKPGHWLWILAEPIVWQVHDAAGNNTGSITVPDGFDTDLGSIPWFGRWLFSPADAQCAQAYILHDWLLDDWGKGRQIEAAGVFYQALKALNVPQWRRMVQTVAVIAAIDTW